MTDKTDDAAEGPIKPQVIELSAEDVTEVKPEPGDAPPEPPPQPMPKPARRKGTLRWIAVALLAGAIAGGWLYRGLLSSYFPTGETEALRNQIGALEANDKAIQDRVNAMVASIDAVNAASAGLTDKVTSAEASIAATNSEIGKLDAKLRDSEAAIAALKSDFETLRNTVSMGGTSGGSVDSAALAAIGQRIDALEKDVASLKSGSTATGGESQAAALSQALADLKAKVAAGTAYQAEYDRIARMVPAAPGLDVLARHAGLGLPAATGLAQELRDLVPSLPVPDGAATESEPGYWDMLWDGLTSIITIRDIGEADWRAVAGEAAVLADGGDLVAAIARIDDAEGAKPAGLTQWRDRAAERLKLEAAIAETAEAVLRQITALGGVQ